MLKSNKGSAIPTIKTILIILITSTILIMVIINLNTMSKIDLNDKKIRTQIALDKIVSSKCFSKKFATISKDNYKQNVLDDCFKKLNNNNNEILLRIKLEGLKSIYLNGKENKFKQKAEFCGINSNLLCSEIKYPIIYFENNKKLIKKLSIQVII